MSFDEIFDLTAGGVYFHFLYITACKDEFRRNLAISQLEECIFIFYNIFMYIIGHFACIA